MIKEGTVYGYVIFRNVSLGSVEKVFRVTEKSVTLARAIWQ